MLTLIFSLFPLPRFTEYLSKIEMHINAIGPFTENTFFHPKPWLHVCLSIFDYNHSL